MLASLVTLVVEFESLLRMWITHTHSLIDSWCSIWIISEFQVSKKYSAIQSDYDDSTWDDWTLIGLEPRPLRGTLKIIIPCKARVIGENKESEMWIFVKVGLRWDMSYGMVTIYENITCATRRKFPSNLKLYIVFIKPMVQMRVVVDHLGAASHSNPSPW